MNTASIAAAAARLLAWAKRRAREPSTWIGLGMAATSAGYSTIGQKLTSVGTILPMVLGAGGAALAAASTSPATGAGSEAAQTVPTAPAPATPPSDA